MIYFYQCQSCADIVEAVRSVGERNVCPDCVKCSAPTRRYITGINIVASPWYDKEGISAGWPVGISEKDKVDKQKEWDKQNDASWDGKSPSKSDYQTNSTVDIFKGLTQDTVHRELASMANAE